MVNTNSPAEPVAQPTQPNAATRGWLTVSVTDMEAHGTDGQPVSSYCSLGTRKAGMANWLLAFPAQSYCNRHRGNRGGGTSPPLHREKNTSWYNIEMLPVNWFMVMSNSRFWTGDGGSDGWEGRTGSHRGAKSSAALGQIERDAVPMRQRAPKRECMA